MSARPLKDHDRRAEPRFAQPGWITLLFEDPAPRLREGLVVDVSERGFRAVYKGPGLPAGVTVEYRRADASGQAVVMWTQVAQDCCTSGFLILETHGVAG